MNLSIRCIKRASCVHRFPLAQAAEDIPHKLTERLNSTCHSDKNLSGDIWAVVWTPTHMGRNHRLLKQLSREAVAASACREAVALAAIAVKLYALRTRRAPTRPPQLSLAAGVGWTLSGWPCSGPRAPPSQRLPVRQAPGIQQSGAGRARGHSHVTGSSTRRTSSAPRRSGSGRLWASTRRRPRRR